VAQGTVSSSYKFQGKKMNIFSMKATVALLAMGFASLAAQATPVTVLTKANTYDTIYGVNFGTAGYYNTTFLGGVKASFSAKSGSSTANFSFKEAQDGYQGVGISPRKGSDRTIGEIDIGESVNASFSQGVHIKNFSVGLLFNGPEYGDLKEKAVISVVYANGLKDTFNLIATGDNSASWSLAGTAVSLLSPATLGKGGAWSVLNPFGNKLVKTISFGAAAGLPSCHGCTNESDYTFMSITAAVPEPETYAMLLAGLAAIGAMVRRKKKA
jgi:hypothetical protein